MASNDKIEELIREIAVKHGIAVGRDDPILVLQTINANLMQDSSTAQQRILESFKSDMEAMTLRWSEDAKGKAERIVTAALIVSKDAMYQGMEASAKASAVAVRREVDAVMSQISSHARWVSTTNLIAAAAALVAAGLALLSSMRH